jgi:hypothetical protein
VGDREGVRLLHSSTQGVIRAGCIVNARPLASFAILFSAALSASVRAAEIGQSGLRIASTRPGACVPVSSIQSSMLSPGNVAAVNASLSVVKHAVSQTMWRRIKKPTLRHLSPLRSSSHMTLLRPLSTAGHKNQRKMMSIRITTRWSQVMARNDKRRRAAIRY